MINRVSSISHILIFFLLSSSAVDAQFAAPATAAASPNYNATLPPNKIPSLDPTISALICVFLFVGCFSTYLRLSAAAPNFHSTRPQPQGIDPQLLTNFPILQYGSAVKQLKFGSSAPECVVCLTEFDHHDKLRLLPKCNHVFHSQCIDAWLASHVTCPVCRTKLQPVEEHGGHRGGNEIVIVIPNEVLNLTHVLGESSVSETEVNLGDRRNRRSFWRCNSTGHSVGLGKIGMKNTLGMSEEERRLFTVHHGGMRRSVSHDVLIKGG